MDDAAEGLLSRVNASERDLLRRIDFARAPAHVAIVMDGNGRWATRRSLSRSAGHRAGVKAVREVVETAARLRLQTLTLFAFSVENWKRPRAEVDTLMALPARYLRLETPTLVARNIRFRVLGRSDRLPASLCKELDRAVAATAANSGMTFNVALNYSGRAEIVDAVKRAIASGVRPDDLDERRFSDLLYTSGQPNPDLIIRTSGELRLSNFFLWQIPYAAIWVTDTLWPDFRRRDLLEAVLAYSTGKARSRYGRAGGVRDRAT